MATMAIAHSISRTRKAAKPRLYRESQSMEVRHSLMLLLLLAAGLSAAHTSERQLLERGDSVKVSDVSAESAEVTNEQNPPDRFNIVYTGEPTLPPPSPHHNIQVFSLPPALTESVAGYLDQHSLREQTTVEKVAVALALDKCAKLAELPDTLFRLGLEEVTFQPSASLAQTCAGYTREMIPKVIGALLASGRTGDIPAMLALIYLLDPGGPGVRVQIESQERESGASAEDIYREVHRLAYLSIPEGNLYYANIVVRHLLARGTGGIPALQADGTIGTAPHRPSFVKAIAYQEALWAIGAEPDRPARGIGLLQRLSDQERVEMQQLADTLVESWLKQPVLFDSDIQAQGYWAPDLY